MPQPVYTPREIIEMDATAVLAAYRAGTLLPSQAVDAYIAHQQRFNGKLNAIVDERYAAARADAARCDELLAQGKPEGALFGVPMSIKEGFDVVGMHTTGGLVENRNRIAHTDANAVVRLKRAGAIILNKTNTPELCFCQETDNNLFGRSNNPWNLARTTGGSSGGEAALMAVGGAAVGFGSDIGGSIRLPAHFCGVVGFKPGAFAYPSGGHYAGKTAEHQEMLIGYGPLAKSVRDAMLVYAAVHPSFRPPRDASLPSRLPVISFASFERTICSRETSRIHFQAQELLRERDAAIDTRPPVFMRRVADAWQLIMSEDKGSGVVDEVYPGRPRAYLHDLLRAKLGRRADHHPFLTWGILGTQLFPPNDKQLRWAVDFAKDSTRQLAETLGETGVLLTPAYPTPAKKHGQVYGEIFSITMSFRKVMPFMALGNVLGLASLIVPCGFSDDGLPIGLQVATPVGNEATMFRVALLLEKAFGGYRRNTQYD
ncbi:MAG TPA: amidase [bacterium]|nr:amidase [bacterium]